MYKVTRFPNGLTVATAAMPHRASVSLGLWVGVGSRIESAAQNGTSHFIEHLLFKGTRKRSPQKISEDVEGIGGYLNAFTGEENTCFYSKACHDRFDELLDVLSDMFLDSRFASSDIKKEREVIKEELAMYFDQPQQHVQELLNATLWPDQPLGRPITGTNQTLDGIGRREVLGFLRQNYVASNTLICAAGNLNHAQVVKAVSLYAKRFVVGPPARFTPVVTNQTAPRVRLHTKATEQTQIALGLRTCSRHDERRYALRLLNTILGENMSSRLFQVLREDHGLAYSIYSSISFFEDTGDLVISAGLDAENLPRALKLIVAELRRLARRLTTPSEMRRARDYAIGQIDLSLENTESQMMWMGEQWLGFGRIVDPAETRRRLAAVTASEIRAAARDFFRPERINLALVSPIKKADALGKILAFD